MADKIIEGLLGGAGSETDSSGNTGLPFGLCEKYGIQTGKDWTPRDAWDALDKKLGMKPNDFYAQLKEHESLGEVVKLPHTQVSTIKKVEDLIKNRKTEKAYIVGENGEVISVTVSSSYARAIFKNVPKDKISKAIVTHNHPPGIDKHLDPFSHDDLGWLKVLKGVRVVNPYGEMSIVKTANFNGYETLKMIDRLSLMEKEYKKEKRRIGNAIKNTKVFTDYDELIEAWGKCRNKYYNDTIELFKKSAKSCGYVFAYKGKIKPFTI